MAAKRAAVWRFLIFGFVAAGGLLVQLALLSVFYRFLGLNYTVALIGSVVVAMVFNYVVHNVLTFRDRTLKGRALLNGLVSFCLASALGGVLNTTVATAFHTMGGHWAVAGLLGAAVGGLVNFTLASRYTWKSDER